MPMERTNSYAIQSLASYVDSDEDELHSPTDGGPQQRRRRSSQRYEEVIQVAVVGSPVESSSEHEQRTSFGAELLGESDDDMYPRLPDTDSEGEENGGDARTESIAQRLQEEALESSKNSEIEGVDVDVDVELERALEIKTLIELNEVTDSPLSQDAAEANNVVVQMPPEPPGKCPDDVAERFEEFFRKKNSGYNLNERIQRMPQFRNPSIYEKLVQSLGIDEIGTNFSRQIYNPHGFKRSDKYDELAKAQRIAIDAAEKDKQKGGAGSDDAKRDSSTALGEGKRRFKSRFDQPTSNGPALHSVSQDLNKAVGQAAKAAIERLVAAEHSKAAKRTRKD